MASQTGHWYGIGHGMQDCSFREALLKKKSALIWTLSKGGGGLTGIQIVSGTIKKVALFPAKFLVGVQDGRGGGSR